MKIYTIKIALHGISPMIWRRIKISGHTSLADLHHIIQVLFNWDDDHLHQFHIYGKDYGISYMGGIAFTDNPYETYIDDFIFEQGDKFTYEYNFFEHLQHDLRIEVIEESKPSTNTVSCIKGNGMPGADKYDEMKVMMRLLEAIANRSLTIDYLQDIRAEFNKVKFNRKLLNHHLKTLNNSPL